MHAQVQVGVNAASENLQAATREAASKVLEAEQREAPLQQQVLQLQVQLEEGRISVATIKEEVRAQRELEAATQAELRAAQEGWRKTKLELEGLRRRQLVESEESGHNEKQLADLQHAQRQQLEAALAAQSSVEERLSETTRQAEQLDRAREASEHRCAEQAVALSNLQGVLEHLQSQARPPGALGSVLGVALRSRRDQLSANIRPTPPPQAADSSEAEQLRLSGMLLARELRQQEAASLPGEEARIALPPLRAALSEAQELNATFESELVGLRASLCASATAAQNADSIDKQLVSQLLVKYFERTRSAEPLTVLASMLDCTPDQRRALGVPQHPSASTALSHQKLSDVWADWLTAEAESLPGN